MNVYIYIYYIIFHLLLQYVKFQSEVLRCSFFPPVKNGCNSKARAASVAQQAEVAVHARQAAEVSGGDTDDGDVE